MKNIEKICLDIDHSLTKDYQAIAPEIVQTSSFQFQDFDHYIRVNSQGEFAYTYTRGDNPTVAILEEKIAQLEGGECAKAFASGMGAISAAILSLVKQGDHIMIVNTVYGSSVKLIQQLNRFGIESTHILVSKTSEIFDHIQDHTKMIYFESPSSQKFELLDLKKIARVAKEKDIYTVIDNTWATSLFQNPLDYGIDVVIHSCSKYIGGHSDIVGGVIVTREELMKPICDFGYLFLGATMTPANAWLAIRGLRTLPVRMKSQEQTVKDVIAYLKTESRISLIYHPLCGDETQRLLAQTYLKGYGSLLGIVLKDATPLRIQKFIDSLECFTLAYSWGGFESLIMPVYKGNNEAELKERGLQLGHMRMYLGLENSQCLINDIKQAIDQAFQ